MLIIYYFGYYLIKLSTMWLKHYFNIYTTHALS